MISEYEIRKKLDLIHKALLEEYKNEQRIGGIAGVSGMAMFEFYYAQLTNDDQYAEIGLDMLSHCMDKINNGYGTPTFSQGIAGMGWVMDHLSIEEFLDDSNDELLTSFDEYLLGSMQLALDNQNFDYLHGAIGYGLYFFNRYKSTQNLELKKQYIDNIRTLLIGLDILSEKDGDGLKWKSDLAKVDRPPCYDLSHAHGLSGIINFLCRIHTINELQEDINPLLEGALNFLHSQRTDNKDDISYFPSQIFDDKELKYKSRVGWCYGDIGPAMAFSRAGKLLKNKKYEELSIELFAHEATKRDVDITFCIDSGFCHGSFGTSYLFKQMADQTQDSALKESATFWLEDGMKKGNNPGSPAGFIQRNGMNNQWINVYNLLEGVTGIGLVMIDHLSDKKLHWDEIFMIG